MNKQDTMLNAIIGFYLLVIVCLIIVGVGYCMNVYKFATSDFKEPYACEATRGAGLVFPPLGGIVGFVTFEEEKEDNATLKKDSE